MKTIVTFLILFLSFQVRAQVADSTILRQIDSLLSISNTLSETRNFEKALTFNTAAEKLALKKLGRETAAYGDLCFQHALVLSRQGNYAEAKQWYQDALNIQGRVLGKEHPDYASTVNYLGRIFKELGDLEKAEALLLEARTIREKVLGKESVEYASNTDALARVYLDMGKYTISEPLFREAMAIRAKVLGEEHSDYAWSLYNLGFLKLQMKEYDVARWLYRDARDIWAKTLGKEHPTYAQSLHDLAIACMEGLDPEEAKQVIIEAIAIREKVLGKENRDYLWSLELLGYLYYQTWYQVGNYEKAERIYLEVKTTREKVWGKEDPDYIEILERLAKLYEAMEQYEKAESVYLEIKTIYKKTINKNHSEYIKNLNALADLNHLRQDYKKAELVYLEIKEICETTTGKEQDEYVKNLVALAVVYCAQLDYQKTEEILLEAKDIMSKIPDRQHAGYAGFLTGAGKVYCEMRAYGKAEPLYLEAKAILEKISDKKDEAYLESIFNLADLYFQMGDYEKCEALLQESSAIKIRDVEKRFGNSWSNIFWLFGGGLIGDYDPEKDLIIEASRHLSELEISSYITRFTEGLNQKFSFAHAIKLLSVTSYNNARFYKGYLLHSVNSYNNALFHKGYLLYSVSQIRKLTMSDSATVSKHLLLQSFKRNLASEYAVPVAEQNSKYIRTLETKVNILEKDIVRTIPTYNDIIRQVSWQEVQTKLSPGSIAIEFVRYQLGHPRRLDSTTIAMVKAELETAPIAEFKERERYSSYSSIERAADSTFNADFERHFKITAEVFGHLEYTDSTMYAAIVLRASDSLPQFVPLFEEKQLAALLKGAAGGSNFLKINALYSEKNLCDLIWKPLEKHLEGISTIYCSPAGLLHRINLAALQPANNSGERQVVLLGSTRTLVLPNETIQAGHDNAYLAGGIRYDGDSTAIAIANLKNAAHRSIELQEGTPVFQPDISGTRSDAFNYLPATATEVRGIGEILASAGISAQIDTGFFATEETFRHLGVNEPSPRIVHLATHGYFFPDPESSLPKAGESLEKEPVFKVSLHPMIRSGLIMAGAREAWTTGKHPKGQEDGILTAYEISQMDLSGTELVVLSACETALGDIAGNEGVYGLQRAFKIAGAKYLIMSLWKVDDRSTQEFMTAFYRHWLAGKMSIPEAFRMAQQEMKVKYPSPYDWAGLVLVE